MDSLWTKVNLPSMDSLNLKPFNLRETHMITSNFICKHGWLSQIERSTLRHTLMRMCFF